MPEYIHTVDMQIWKRAWTFYPGEDPLRVALQFESGTASRMDRPREYRGVQWRNLRAETLKTSRFAKFTRTILVVHGKSSKLQTEKTTSLEEFILRRIRAISIYNSIQFIRSLSLSIDKFCRPYIDRIYDDEFVERISKKIFIPIAIFPKIVSIFFFFISTERDSITEIREKY